MLGEWTERPVDGPRVAMPAASAARIGVTHYRTQWLLAAILHQPHRTHSATTGEGSATLQPCLCFHRVLSSTT